MPATITLPDDAHEQLRAVFGDGLDRFALEAIVIEAYRRGEISLGRVGAILGLATSIEADDWLAERKVPLNMTPEDLMLDWTDAGQPPAADRARRKAPRGNFPRPEPVENVA